MIKCAKCEGTGFYCCQPCCKAHECAYCKGTGKMPDRAAEANARKGGR